MIKASSSYVQQTTQTSCIETNLAQSLYHERWNVKAQKIECPQHLTEVTGCRLNSQGLPKADPTIQTATQVLELERLRHDHDAGLLQAELRLADQRQQHPGRLVDVLPVQIGRHPDDLVEPARGD